MDNYIVATIKEWNIDAFKKNSVNFKGNWFHVGSPEELTTEFLNRINPRYIFFPHWSWLVPKIITDSYECICFHMTDLPYGRGGSPLQNLIIRGHKITKLTALRMVDEIDAGPIYKKVNLSLDGSANNIYETAAKLVYELIATIIQEEPIPIEQTGKLVHFQRLSPAQSILPKSSDIGKLFDHIRMLDAKSYPQAYLKHGDLKLEFSNAKYVNDELECTVRIKKVKK